MLTGGARAQRARTWSHGCNTAHNLRGDRAGYRRNRFGGSPVGTASSPARVSTSARWNQCVGKTLSGYPLATRMEVATWPSSSAASSGPNAPIFKTPPSLKSITGGRRLSSSRRTAMRAREPQGDARTHFPRSSRPSRSAKESEEEEPAPATPLATIAPPPPRQRRSRRWTGPLGTPRRMTPSLSTSTSLSETRVLAGWMSW